MVDTFKQEELDIVDNVILALLVDYCQNKGMDNDDTSKWINKLGGDRSDITFIKPVSTQQIDRFVKKSYKSSANVFLSLFHLNEALNDGLENGTPEGFYAVLNECINTANVGRLASLAELDDQNILQKVS